MNFEKLDLEKEVKLKDTSRYLYNDVPISSDIFVNDDINNTDKQLNTENIVKRKRKRKIDDELLWFYTVKRNGWNKNETIYAIDKEGNPIAEYSISEINAKLKEKEGIEIENAEEDKVFEIAKTTKKKIDFTNSQDTLKKEITGYPEFNEKLFKLYNHEQTMIRFKKEKNILRSLFDATKVSQLRLLLSLCQSCDYDYLQNLIKDEIICLKNFNREENIVYNLMVRYYNKYGKFPYLKHVVNALELPYSIEFFDEYLFKEDELDFEISNIYQKRMEEGYKKIGKILESYRGPSTVVVNTLVKLESQCTPIVYDEIFNTLENRLENKKDDKILSTGIGVFDESNIYLQKGKITTVFAYTGGYKTMFCTNVAYNIIKNGGNVLYISLEIDKEDMYSNFLSRHSYNFENKISHSDIKGSRLTEKDRKYLFNKVYPDFKEKLKPNLIVYDETDIKQNNQLGFNKLLIEAEKIFNKRNSKGIDLIVIDHINLFKFSNNERHLNDYSAVNHWIGYFRKNCINFLGRKKQVAILCASQSSREGYKNAQKTGRYELTGIAEANEIERSSQLVLSIYAKELNQAKMQVLKSRDGKSDFEIDLTLDAKYYTFGITSEIIVNKLKDKKLYDDSNIINDTSIFEVRKKEK